jgi:hypothetical protein
MHPTPANRPDRLDPLDPAPLPTPTQPAKGRVFFSSLVLTWAAVILLAAVFIAVILYVANT